MRKKIVLVILAILLLPALFTGLANLGFSFPIIGNPFQHPTQQSPPKSFYPCEIVCTSSVPGANNITAPPDGIDRGSVKWSFSPNGTWSFANGFDELGAQGISAEWGNMTRPVPLESGLRYYNATFDWYHFTYPASNVSVYEYFQHAAHDYGVNVTIAGTLPSSGNLYLQFHGASKNTPQPNDCWTGNNTQCSLLQWGSESFSWSDSLSYKPYFDNSTDILSYQVGKSFDIDPFALDGNSQCSTTTTGCSSSFSTSNVNDVFIIMAMVDTTGVTVSVSGGSLTWTQRGSYSITGALTVGYFYAEGNPGSSLSWSCSANGGGLQLCEAFGISGAPTSNFFDTHSGLPVETSCTNSCTPSLTISTSNANDFVFGLVGAEGGGTTNFNAGTLGGTAMTLLNHQQQGSTPSDQSADEYLIVTSAQSSATMNFGNSVNTYNIMIGDAVIAQMATQPINIATPNGGSSFTYTVSGCGVSPTSGTSGSTTNFVAIANCVLTVTMPAAGANSRYVFASNSATATVRTCGSGTCTAFQPNDWYQLQNTFKYTVQDGGSPSAPSESIWQTGNPVTNTISTSGTSIWTDYGFPAAPDLTSSGSSTEQWSPTPLTSGLVGYWACDEGTANYCFDTSTSQDIASFSGSTPYTWAGSLDGFAPTSAFGCDSTLPTLSTPASPAYLNAANSFEISPNGGSGVSCAALGGVSVTSGYVYQFAVSGSVSGPGNEQVCITSGTGCQNSEAWVSSVTIGGRTWNIWTETVLATETATIIFNDVSTSAPSYFSPVYLNSPFWSGNCLFGNCLTFQSGTGSTPYLSVPSNSALDPTGAVTVSVWFKTSLAALTQFEGIVGGCCTASAYHMYHDTSGAICFEVVSSAGSRYNSCGPTITANTWYFLTGVYSGNSVYIYYNGILENHRSDAPSGIALSNGFADTSSNICGYSGQEIGCTVSNNPNSQTLDDVRVYNRALSSGEIQELFSSTIPNNENTIFTGGNTYNTNYYHQYSNFLGYTTPASAADQYRYTSIGQSYQFPATTTSQTVWTDNTTFVYPTGVIPAGADSNLVAYWPLNEGQGDGVFDYGPSTNNGVLQNSPSWVTGAPFGGNAISFSASGSQSIQVPTATAFELTTFSLNAWVDPTGTTCSTGNTGSSEIAATNPFGISSGWEFRCFDNSGTETLDLEAAYSGGYASHSCNAALPPQNTWSQVTATISGTSYVIYLNGVSECSGSLSGTLVYSDPGIGLGSLNAYGATPQNFWSGGLSDIRVFSTALTAGQVSSLYSYNTITTSQSFTATPLGSYGLVGYWLADEGAGSATYDLSGNNNYGTLSGGVYYNWNSGTSGWGVACGGSGAPTTTNNPNYAGQSVLIISSTNKCYTYAAPNLAVGTTISFATTNPSITGTYTALQYYLGGYTISQSGSTVYDGQTWYIDTVVITSSSSSSQLLLSWDGNSAQNYFSFLVENSPMWVDGTACLNSHNCLQFNSGTNYVNAISLQNGVGVLPTGAAPRTMYAWIYLPQSPPSNGCGAEFALGYGSTTSASGDSSLGIYNSNSEIAAYLNSNYVVSNIPVKTKVWTFITMTYDGNLGLTFSNGTNFDSITLSQPLSTGTVGGFIGQLVNGGCGFEGWIQDVGVLNRALSASEIGEIFASSVPNLESQIGSSGNTYSPTYYNQYAQTVSFTVSGGGSYTPPSYFYTSLGQSLTYTATTTASTIWVDNGASWSYQNPTSGSTNFERWRANSGAYGTVTGPATENPTYYHQFYLTFSYYTSPSDTIPNPTLSYTKSGLPATLTLLTSQQSDWMDVGTPWSVTNPVTDSSNQKWYASPSGGTINSPTTITIVYTISSSFKLSYVVIDGGSPTAPQLVCYFNGVPTTYTLTTTPTVYPCTPGQSWSVTNPLSGSTGTHRWQSNQITSGIVGGNSTTVYYYYSQFYDTFTWNLLGGGSPTNPSLNFVQFGTSQLSSPITASQPFSVWIDNTTAYSFPNPLLGSSGSERWQSASATSGTVTSSFSVTWNYYHQYLMNFRYAVVSGTPNTNPTLTARSFGSQITPALSKSYVSYWLDYTSAWSATSPWSSNLQTFFATPAQGQVSSPGASETISYGLAPKCNSNDPFANEQSGCVVPAFFLSWNGNIGDQWMIAIVAAAISGAVYWKSENAIMALLVFMGFGAVMLGLFPAQFGELGGALLVLGIAGSVYSIYRNRT